MSMVWIAGQTISVSGGEASFSSIPQSFTHLQLRIFSKSPTGSAAGTSGFTTSFDSQYLRFNNDATPANYADHKVAGDGASVTSSGAFNQITAARTGVMPITTAPAGVFGVNIVDILDYSNTSKNKVFRYISGTDLNGSGYSVFGSGLWTSTAAINNIFVGGFTAGFSVGSRFDLYGITSSQVTGA